MFECYSQGTATFLILGHICTRNCAFCNITPGLPEPLDMDEPRRVGQAVKTLGLKHAVITSVTRDDLTDGGSAHFAAVIRAVREASQDIAPSIEVLIPDFKGSLSALQAVLAAAPEIINHNVETPPSHYARIRPQADYAQSLELLSRVRQAGGVPKSGLMVGLGETDEEVRGVLRDLAGAGCRIATVGQYMRPSRNHPAVERYVHPGVFERYAEWGREAGIDFVFSAPLVRSSYNAGRVFEEISGKDRF
jgi:lipoic acid synthetase